MKSLTIVLLLSISMTAFAQQKKFTFSGTVTSSFSKKPVEGIPVKITTANGFKQEVFTDGQGKYLFSFTAQTLPVSILIAYNSKSSELHNPKLATEIYRDKLTDSGPGILLHDVGLEPGDHPDSGR
jgi:hypothetical protein